MFQMDRWQTYQSDNMFTRIQKFHVTQKLQLKHWQSQIVWKYEKRSSRNIWRWTRGVWSCSVSENPYQDLDDVNEIDLRECRVKVKTEKELIKRGCFRVQKRVKNLRQKFSIYSRLLYFNSGWNFSCNCNFLNSVYRVEIST